MPHLLRFSKEADEALASLERGGNSTAKKLRKVKGALAKLEQDPRYPGLNSHQYQNFPGLPAGKVWDSYVENNTPGAWRIYWYYGPNEKVDGVDVPVITIVEIGPHR